jgi:indolepyruvate ferredoxin oxidoreductase
MNAPVEHKRLTATLDDKYTIEEGWAFMTGTQALVRLPVQQRLRDRARGFNTAGYISGYRGSPLGQYDQALWQAAKLLEQHDIVFRPGLNEELAATAVSGSQYVGLLQGRRVDGVFSIWYGKAPGVDRAADALRHGNWAGTGPLGGVLALAGDDHGAKSSSIACYSDQVFESLGMPLLYPSSTQEVLDLGLHGIAMSRFSGLWAGFKCVTDVIEAGSPVYVGPDSPEIVLPDDFVAPEGGLSIRPYELTLLPQEERIYHHRIYAALAYARANRLNRIVHSAPDARIGIVSAGKAFQDVEQALARLGLDDAGIRQQGLRVLRVGMTWPLDPEIVAEFARGLQTVIVVEEKRPLLENQLRSILYGTANAPRLVGKLADQHLFSAGPRSFVFPNFGEIDPTMVMKAIVDAVTQLDPQSRLAERLPAPVAAPAIVGAARTPSFCSGCPHNRSTKLPEGSRGLAGIGCHGMAVMLDPKNYQSISQMGGEGMHWLGQQPFTTEPHVFANLGDGTYAHSGLLAVRQAVAAKVPITYKILYNGFVSMTGGQPVESGQSVDQIVHALYAEGVRKLAVVTDEPAKYSGVALPPGVLVHERSHLDVVQREFRTWPDVSVIVYDQACATERRRLRKKGEWSDPAVRPFINSAVCEGCGDCGRVSTCLSIEPLDTEFGRKRRINHSSCNKDLTCIEGFCPSFVTVQGGKPRQGSQVDGSDARFANLPEPTLPSASEAFNILVCGIGGTGVVTIGKVLAMAAHLDGLHCTSLDVMGMAQKYGAVLSHVRIATAPEQLHATRIGAGETDALIGCDLIVATGDEALRTFGTGRTRAVVCSDLITTAEFPRNPDWRIDANALQGRMRAVVGEDAATFLEGQRLATSLLGDAIGANMFMVGMAWQKGMIPLTLAAIERAIELNGVSVAMNRRAFDWGRRAAHLPQAVEALAAGTQGPAQSAPAPRTLDELIEHRRHQLVEYRNEAYARRYTEFVAKVRAAESRLGGGDSLTTAVATQYYRLLAVKDEWEVARLYSRPEFRQQLSQAFEGDYKLSFHLGAWPFAKRDPVTGQMGKAQVGGWMMGAFGVMSRLRFLRGTMLDPFRGSAERQLDRHWLEQYERDIEAQLATLDQASHGRAVEIAAVPERVRGFGHVREANAKLAQAERDRLVAQAAA